MSSSDTSSIAAGDDGADVDAAVSQLVDAIADVTLATNDDASSSATSSSATTSSSGSPSSSTSPSSSPPPFDVKWVAHQIRTAPLNSVVVMTGAGISVSAGIPDFRSPKTGLYANLQKYKLPCPEAVFELRYFRHAPHAFCVLARELYPGAFAPTPTHHFIALLEEKQLLRRCYTQNIDGLELLAGVTAERLVQAHGGFQSARCIDCGHAYSGEWVKSAIMAARVPRCTREGCVAVVDPSWQRGYSSSSEEEEEAAAVTTTTTTTTTTSSSSTTTSSSSVSNVTTTTATSATTTMTSDTVVKVMNTQVIDCGVGGLVKPDIVFFGEQLPQRFHTLVGVDLPAPRDDDDDDDDDDDSTKCLLVLGTSLQVHPFAGLVHRVHHRCARALINREPVGECHPRHIELLDSLMARADAAATDAAAHIPGFRFNTPRHNTRDAFLGGDCDDVIYALCDELGWRAELDARVAAATAAAAAEAAARMT